MMPVTSGLPMAEYLRQPAFSASLAHTLVTECPRAAWFRSWLNPHRPPSEDTDGTDAGQVAHAILLEGSSQCVQLIDPTDHPAEKTGTIPIGWTNKSIRAARDAARAAGKIPMLVDDMRLVAAMVDSAREFIESLRHTEPAIWRAFQSGGGESELSCFWQDGPTLCRMRPDRINSDRDVIIDAKFTKRSSEPNGWSRSQLGPLGYRISAAFYRRGAHALFKTQPSYTFLVVQQEPPHLCSLVGVDPANFAYGAEQVKFALREWQGCVAANDWPAYPNRCVYPELAPWENAQYETLMTTGHPYDPAMLFGEREAA